MRVCPRCGTQTEAAACPDDGATTVPVTTAAATYPSGTVIDERYRIDSVLGIGGFGAVYKGTQLAMDQVVAIKVLKSEHIQSEEHVKRFAREAKAASKLRHPNTIRIFDFGSHTDHALYLAMEFLEGDTLAARLDHDQQMSAPQVGHIISQVCHSLTEAHEHGIIHRDLKPENIMLLSVPGVDDFVKVLDFGIAAKVAESNENDEKLTEMGMIMGTPTYMSPEQALGKPLDARSDVYALGVLMYEALTGKVPFEGDQPMNVLVRHINDPPVEPRKRAPEADIPKAMERLVLRCLEKDPRHRPQTTAELAAEIDKALNQPEGSLRRGIAVDPEPQDAVATTALPHLADEPVQQQTSSVPAPRPRIASERAAAADFAEPSTGKRPIWLALGAVLLFAGVIGVVAIAVPPAEAPAGAESDAATPTPGPGAADAQAAAPTPAPDVAAAPNAAQAEADAGSAAPEADVAAVAAAPDTPEAEETAAVAAAAPDAAPSPAPARVDAAAAGARPAVKNATRRDPVVRAGGTRLQPQADAGTTAAAPAPAADKGKDGDTEPRPAADKPKSGGDKPRGSRDDFRLQD